MNFVATSRQRKTGIVVTHQNIPNTLYVICRIADQWHPAQSGFEPGTFWLRVYSETEHHVWHNVKKGSMRHHCFFSNLVQQNSATILLKSTALARGNLNSVTFSMQFVHPTDIMMILRMQNTQHTGLTAWFDSVPSKHRRWRNAGSMLSQHCRRWASIVVALRQRLVFAIFKWN